jgi:hypothetical protein
MADVTKHLYCDPQGIFVTEKRVKKFSSALRPNEKAHYILPLQLINLEDREKMRCTLNGLLLATQQRILILYRKTLGEDDIFELDYSDYNSIEEYGMINLNPKYALKSSSREDKIKIAGTIKSSTDDLSAAIQFMENAIRGNSLDSNLSHEQDSNDEDSEKTVESEATGELRRTCKSCGNVWHVETKEIRDLKKKKKENEKKSKYQGLMGAPAAGNISEKNRQDAVEKLKKLNKCPECRSSNYKEEKVEPGDLENKSEAGNSGNNSSDSGQELDQDEINYCPQCGRKIRDKNAAYCSKCGTELN